MKKLWVTYAWKDNESMDVDFIIQQLGKQEIDVRFDRRQLLTGRPLWEQIDQHITEPQNSDAWAFVVSKQSLLSAACKEELNYALRRALDSRGPSYPLIGIFAETIDQALIPSAIATRLYVNLADAKWAERVKAGVDGVPFEPSLPDVASIYSKVWYSEGPSPVVLEARPRMGLWNPCVAGVLAQEKGLVSIIVVRPSDKLPRPGLTLMALSGPSRDGIWEFHRADPALVASPTMSMYVYMTALPSVLLVGSGDSLTPLVFGPSNTT